MQSRSEYAVAQNIVKALYRAVLRRNPDVDGWKAHTQRLEEDLSEENIEQLIRSFLWSPELLHSHFATTSGGAFLPQIAYPISLGSHCYTSNLLKKLQMKLSSMPFDWLFSSIEMVVHCLDDDFGSFLDRRYYKSVPIQHRVQSHVNLCEHSLFEEKFGVRYVFNHRDPLGAEDYKYFERCVHRFRLALDGQSQVPVFAVTFRSSPDDLRRFLHLRDALRRRRVDCRLLGFAVAQPTSLVSREEVLDASEGSYLSVIHPVSEWMDIRFGSALDDLFMIGRIAHALQCTFGMRVES